MLTMRTNWSTMKEKENNRKFKCDKCKKSYYRLNQLFAHTRMKHTHTAATLIETIKSKYSSEYESLCLVPKDVTKPTKLNIDRLETSRNELEALAQRNVSPGGGLVVDGEPAMGKLDDIKGYSDSNSTTSAATTTTTSSKEEEDDDDEDIAAADAGEKMEVATPYAADDKKLVNAIDVGKVAANAIDVGKVAASKIDVGEHAANTIDVFKSATTTTAPPTIVVIVDDGDDLPPDQFWRPW